MRKNRLLLAFIIVLCTLISNQVSAQSPLKFGIGIEGGIPIGSASDGHSAAIGANLNVLFPLPVNNLSVIGSAGYQQWFIKGEVKDLFKEEGIDVKSPGFIPIRVGARYGIAPSPFYIKFDLGPAISVKEPIEGVDSGTAMSYSPGAGVKLGSFEAELKFDIYSKSGESLSFFGLKLSHYFN